MSEPNVQNTDMRAYVSSLYCLRGLPYPVYKNPPSEYLLARHLDMCGRTVDIAGTAEGFDKVVSHEAVRHRSHSGERLRDASTS